MINLFFESIFFLLASCTIILSVAGYGNFLNYKYKKNFFEKIFFGIIIITFLVTLIHFFFKISFYIAVGLLFIGLILFLRYHKSCLTKLYKSNLLYLIIFLILLPIYISQKYHEDFGYYHLPYVITMIEEKVIFGLANSNSAYAHNSIWLNTISLFSLPKNNFNFLTLPSYLIYNLFIIFSLKNILKLNNQKISNYFLIICVFYLLLKFTRISEYGNDLPATIFSILSIFYFLRYSETKKNQNKLFYFFCCFSFAVFSVLIKLSAIPILLLPLILLLKNYEKLKKEIFNVNYLFIFLLVFIFYLQQFVYTSCIIFPAKFTCVNTEWFNFDLLLLRENIELINKSYYGSDNLLTKENYLSKLNWFSFWLARNYPEILENILTIFLPILLLIFFLPKEKNKSNLFLENKSLFILFIFLSFIYWFKFSPVYRFSIPYFLSLFFIISLNFYANREFSKKIFLFLILFSLLFNFTKNILRINNKDYIFFGIENIQNQFYVDKLSENNFIKVYRPDIKNNKNGWQGRLCWDIPFICSYKEIRVNKNYGYLFFSKLNN